MTEVQIDAATPAPRTPVWLTVVISGGLGLFYAYAVWNAVDFLVRQATGALGLNGLGWAVLLLPVIFPIVVFGAAFALGYRRPPHHLLLVLLTGLGLVAAFWLNIVAYAAVQGASLLG